MGSTVEHNEEESFIILGSSPGTSLDITCNGMKNGAALDKAQIEDAMKDLSMDDSATKQLSDKASATSNLSMDASAMKQLSDKASAMSNLSMDASAMKQLSDKTSAMSNISMEGSAMKQLSDKASAMSNLSMDASAMKQLSDKTSAMSNISMKGSATKELSDKTSAMSNLSMDASATKKLSDKASAMSNLSMEASASYQAHFNLAECPSPASMMVANNIITEDKSTEELQKRFGEILDENIILKDTLQANNDSLKEQFLMIASCQEDMLKTTMQHKEKFEETKILIEKLRQENKRLKQEIAKQAEAPKVNGETGEQKAECLSVQSGPSSALEFVTSPEDDTVDKLTAQLELVEKQRRQVITDNEKLTWQKESLEQIVDATTKERDNLKEKLKLVELELSNKIAEHETQVRELNFTVAELQNKIEVISIPPEEVSNRDAIIKQVEEKCASLVFELKNAKQELLKVENMKMELADHKSSTQEIVKIQMDNLQEMHSRLKLATTTLFQPVRISVCAEPNSTELGSFTSNVKLYDRALKHLADLLNKVTHGLSDSLVETLGVILSLYDYRLERATEAEFKAGLANVKKQIENQQCDALNNIGQVRGTLSIFEGIFKDYKDILKNSQEKSNNTNIEELTAALVARGQELQMMEIELKKLRTCKGDTDHLMAQLDIYKSDFEAERQAREKMASEKDSLHTDLRKAQRQIQELTQQLEEVRGTSIQPRGVTSPSSTTPASRPKSAVPGKMVYRCPKCMQFSTDQLRLLEDHLDFCLDDF